ncbi:MAG: KH domain-containing protein [Candidatus Helarchaeota archaeon]|nr:KH domain-containing protein [Candidatus Helarchaeota archaeon]
MKEFVEYIVKKLVDHPEEVSINEVEGEKTIVLELKVANGELGKVIGKNGRIAQAIRTLLAAMTARSYKRVVLEILE